MSSNVATRTPLDRLRYSISFEISLMALLVPAGSLVFDRHFADVGLLSLVLAIQAMLLNVFYNWAFDQVDARNGRVSSDRGTFGRVIHAIGFEVTLMAGALPILMWWLNLGFLTALATDIAVATLVVFFTYFFTLGYDRLFPVRKTRT